MEDSPWRIQIPKKRKAPLVYQVIIGDDKMCFEMKCLELKIIDFEHSNIFDPYDPRRDDDNRHIENHFIYTRRKRNIDLMAKDPDYKIWRTFINKIKNNDLSLFKSEAIKPLRVPEIRGGWLIK